MAILIGFLTLLMVLDCVIVVLLVLIQLPKKDAGAGLAFGGGATDALFGAGSGNVLTKITKYAAGIFLVMAVGLSIMQSAYYKKHSTQFQRELEQPAKAPIPMAAPAPAPTTTKPATATSTNVFKLESTNLPVAPANTSATPAA